MSSAVSPVLPNVPRKRRIQRILRRTAGALLCLILLAFTVHFLLVRQMRLPRLSIVQGSCVTAVSVRPDGQTIFSGEGPAYDLPHFVQDAPRDIFVWSAADGRLLRKLPGFYWRSSGITASPDGRQVIACGASRQDDTNAERNSILVWDWQTGKKQWGIQDKRSEDFMPFSYSSTGALVGCLDNIRASATGKLLCRTSAHGATDGQSEFTPDGKLFGIIDDGTLGPKTHKMREDNGNLYYSTTRLHFWRTDTGKAVWTRERRMNGPDADPDAVLNSVAVSPNGKYVVLASSNSHLIVLDAQTGRELFRPFIPPGTTIPDWEMPGGLAFSVDGQTLVSRCGRRVLVWDASSLQ